ncbi:DUF4132 domain-containing protein [Actinomadura rifamycini]|uniref:DUF4132 domain-containing protein n=1 Tax=Actinomadura rifamycini TaxID=31962 RepID=UPI0006871241|nr:DUF4132 domain-containing protein [Actinomadura rifamycini]
MPHDEDVLTLPAAWRRHLHPRRGGAPGPAVRADGARDVPALLAEASGALDALLAGRHGDPARAGAARRHLAGTPDPAGAAVVAAVTALATRGRERGRREIHRAFAGYWAAEHGPAFAARAVVELARTAVRRAGGGPWRGCWLGAEPRARLETNTHDALRRVRTALAAAGDAEYAEAERRLAPFAAAPAAEPVPAWLAAYLVPTRRDWTDACLAAGADLGPPHRPLMLCAIGDAARLGDPADGPLWRHASREVLATLADGVGADLLPFLLRLLDHRGLDGRERAAAWETVAVLPSDAAFRALLDAALPAGAAGGRRPDRHAKAALSIAMERFPVRALRLLAASGAAGARDLLADHVRTRPDAVAGALPDLPDGIRAAVGPLAAVPAAAVPEETPPFLAELPWDRPVKPVVPGLKPPAGRRFASPDRGWDADVRSEGLQYRELEDPDWDELLDRYRRRMPRHLKVRFLMRAPDAVVRPLLADWNRPEDAVDGGPWPLTLVARHGLDAFPFAWTQATARPGLDGRLLVPYLDAAVARWMGERWERAESVWAREWLDLHGLGAVPYLAPAALGRKAGERRGAEAALRALADAHGAGAVAGAFPEAADELRAVLSAHPLRTGLVPRPKPPAWADPAALPAVPLRGRDAVLPADATRSLVGLLASPAAYATGDMRASLDPDALMEFGWALFVKWRAAGEPAKHGWALAQLGRTGGDATVARLVPVIAAWPGEGGHAKAVEGLDVLGAIGTDAALAALREIAEESPLPDLPWRARERFRGAAEARGLTSDRLEDRLVPRLGLDADAATTLDYGPRRFRVRFDERLQPRVFDESGTPRATLPKPAAKDDPHLAPAAYRTFGELKREVRRVLADRRRALEKAMLRGRRWAPDEFREHLAGHPVVGRVVRRLVWLAEDGGAATAFRIAEDGTFADVRDDPFVPAESARVRVAHPAHLGDDLPAWCETFADYEVLQPFPQLDRPAVRLSRAERAGDRLDRYAGRALHAADFRAARNSSPWRAGRLYTEPGDERWAWWDAGGGRCVVVGLGTGPWPHPRDADPVMTVEYVRASTRPAPKDGPLGGDPVPFGDLDAATVSEALTVLFPSL